MLLTIDIGNTNMVLGVFERDTIVSKSASGTKVRCRHWCGRIRPIPSRTPARRRIPRTPGRRPRLARVRGRAAGPAACRAPPPAGTRGAEVGVGGVDDHAEAVAGPGDGRGGGGRVGDVDGDGADAVAVLRAQVGELLRAARGRGDEVADLERGGDEGAAEAARGTRRQVRRTRTETLALPRPRER